MVRLTVGFAFLLTLSILLGAGEIVVREPTTETFLAPPSPPKTRAQIQSEAWTLAGQIKTAAGRKTASGADGGTALMPPAVISADTEWVSKTANFTRTTYINLTAFPVTRNLWVNNSLLDGGGSGVSYSLFTPNFVTNPGGSTSKVNIMVKNSTLRNFREFAAPTPNWGYLNTHTLNVWLDNVTVISTSRQLVPNYNVNGACQITWNYCNQFITDSTFRGCNRANNSVTCVDGNDIGKLYVNRSKFTVQTSQNGGAISIRGPRAVVLYNWVTDGSNQIVYQGNIAGSGLPRTVEAVNVSYNYLDKSTHTAIGIFGQSSSAFWGPGIWAPYKAMAFKNVVANGTYINIQTGTVGNVTFYYNYITGPANTFTESFGLNWRPNNITVRQNYIWNRNTEFVHGIVIADFPENLTVQDNVVYDVGLYHLSVNGGRKNSDLTSDYLWRGNSVQTYNNWFEGCTFSACRLVRVESGYFRSHNDTLTGAAKPIEVLDGWNCPGCSFVEAAFYDPILLNTSGVMVSLQAPGNQVDVRVYKTTKIRFGLAFDGTFYWNGDGRVTGFQAVKNFTADYALLSYYGVFSSKWDTSEYQIRMPLPKGFKVDRVLDNKAGTTVLVSEGGNPFWYFTAAAGGDYTVDISASGVGSGTSVTSGTALSTVIIAVVIGIVVLGVGLRRLSR